MTPAHRPLWKLATKALIRDAGGLDAASALLEQIGLPLSLTQLSRCQTGHAPDMLSAGHALALTEATGSAAFAELFAPLAGKRLAPARGAEQAAPSGIAALCALISEASEVVHKGAEALADGALSATEEDAILKALGDLTEVKDDFLASVAQRRAGL